MEQALTICRTMPFEVDVQIRGHNLPLGNMLDLVVVEWGMIWGWPATLIHVSLLDCTQLTPLGIMFVCLLLLCLRPRTACVC